MKNFNEIFKATMKEYGEIEFRFITKDFKKIYGVKQKNKFDFRITELITQNGETTFLKNEWADTDEVANFMVDFLESLVKVTKKYGEPETIHKLCFVTFKF